MVIELVTNIIEVLMLLNIIEGSIEVITDGKDEKFADKFSR